jgi:hypothetical protein
MLSRLDAENTAVTMAYTFPTPTSELIRVKVESYHFNKDKGRLSMTGRAQQSDNGEFILKGDNTDLYGWVVFRDRNLAFEYTTDANRMVIVEQVPVEKIFPVCAFETLDGHAFAGISPEAHKAGPEPHIGPYPAGLPVTRFQSKPGAPRVLYWDLSEAHDIWTPAEMWEAWQGYAAGFSAFDVNVTTDPDVYAATPVENRGIAHQLTSEDGISGCGIGSFGTDKPCTIYKKASPVAQGGTLFHESGHQVGLFHDRSVGNAYFPGFAAFQWVPIMGNYPLSLKWDQRVWQFSKGEFADSREMQDDFEVITKTTKIPFRAKTHVGTKPLKLNGTRVPALENRGQIVRSTDLDIWSFEVTGALARAKLKLFRTESPFGSMLDIDASILDAAGNSMARSNKPVNRDAEFDVALPAGKYALTVKGGAEGTPAEGFSNYSSLGFYAIEGEITGVVGVAKGADPRNAISMRPIAAGDRMNLNIPLHKRVDAITLYAGDGKITFTSSRRVNAIDMSGLSAGNYLLRIAVDGAVVSRTIVWK